jgi:Reverse transcriptase (RNA-dependent DNA polymerase)
MCVICHNWSDTGDLVDGLTRTDTKAEYLWVIVLFGLTLVDFTHAVVVPLEWSGRMESITPPLSPRLPVHSARPSIIEPCSSPWAANVVLVLKKTGGVRCAIDYRKLNRITRGDSYPLPRIQACLDSLQDSSWFSTLDLRSGFWQVRLNPCDADKPAFITRRGCFRFKVLSFGLVGATSTFQRLMDIVLSGLTWFVCLV